MKKVTLICASLFAAGISFAQQKLPTSGPGVINGPTQVLTPTSFKVTQSLNMLLSKDKIDKIDFDKVKEMHDRDFRKAQPYKYTAKDGAQYGNDPASIQTEMGTRQPQIGVIKKWAGQNGGYDPQDPTGAVGMTKYVQAVNASPFSVYDKTGTGTATYTGDIGTITSGGQNGDPVVLYDKFADRWLVGNLGGGNNFAMAISATNDPAGSWYAYTFTPPEMPDYLKFSVWENGYYMTSNNGVGRVYCFEKAAMLVGNAAARAIYQTFTEPTNAGFGFWLPLPADADGVIPPSGTRIPLFAYTDDGWGTGEIDGVKIWSMGVTWGTTPAANITLDATIPTAAFDASYNSSWNDITQPGTQMMDGLGGVCMFRAQWNNFIGTNRVVLNWAVKLAGTQRSIKWVELRQNQSTGVWSLYQEGIYAPDANNRWCGSIAMDCNGDIALCYAKTSSTIPISLAYTGRVPSDPLGTMSIAENVVFTGTGSITSSNRFGDYSHTSIDPANGDIFWHTGMYSSGGSATGIYSFQIAACTSGVDNMDPVKPELTAFQSGNVINVKTTGLPLDEKYYVQLYDISGKEISENRINSVSKAFETTIEVNGLSSGIYIVRIGTPDFQKVVKVPIK